MGKRIFVTVGTTEFPKLIKAITTEKVLLAVTSLGYNFIQIQTGKGSFKVENVSLNHKIRKEGNSTVIDFENNLTIKYDSYFENFDKEIAKSDLIISHAGAGTCLEVLRKKKALLVVINEDLMDNHQIELAEKLQNDGYLFYTFCDTLEDVLSKDFSKLDVYPEPEKFVFSEYLDKSMGFM